MHASLGKDKNHYWREWIAAAGLHFQKSRHRIDKICPWNEFNNPASGWTGSDADLLRISEDMKCIWTGRGTVTETGETALEVLNSVGLSNPIDISAICLSPSFGFGFGDGWKTYFANPKARLAMDEIEFHVYGLTPSICMGQIAQVYDYLERKFSLCVGEISWPLGNTLSDDQKCNFIRDIYRAAPSFVSGEYLYAYNHQDHGTLVDSTGKVLTPMGQTYKQLQIATM